MIIQYKHPFLAYIAYFCYNPATYAKGSRMSCGWEIFISRSKSRKRDVDINQIKLNMMKAGAFCVLSDVFS